MLNLCNYKFFIEAILNLKSNEKEELNEKLPATFNIFDVKEDSKEILVREYKLEIWCMHILEVIEMPHNFRIACKKMIDIINDYQSIKKVDDETIIEWGILLRRYRKNNLVLNKILDRDKNTAGGILMRHLLEGQNTFTWAEKLVLQQYHAKIFYTILKSIDTEYKTKKII